MTEHAAGIFVFFFLGEYASIILICILITLILLGGYDVITIFFFLQEIVYTFIYFIFSSIYTILLNISFIVLAMLDVSSNIVYNNSFNLLHIINNITENIQFNQSMNAINYTYSNNIKLGLENGINNLIYNLNIIKNFNFLTDILKDILNNQIYLSLIYALGISIKTIILVFSFI
jgi:NADH:ubiquinone oxidoreductase subunit H